MVPLGPLPPCLGSPFCPLTLLAPIHVLLPCSVCAEAERRSDRKPSRSTCLFLINRPQPSTPVSPYPFLSWTLLTPHCHLYFSSGVDTTIWPSQHWVQTGSAVFPPWSEMYVLQFRVGLPGRSFLAYSSLWWLPASLGAPEWWPQHSSLCLHLHRASSLSLSVFRSLSSYRDTSHWI